MTDALLVPGQAASGQAGRALQGGKVECWMGGIEALQWLGSREERKLNRTDRKGKDAAVSRAVFKESALLL